MLYNYLLQRRIMIEITIKCESLEEARIYLNGPQYHNLISDLCGAFHSARKHGESSEVIALVDNYMPDLFKAVENSEGAY